MTTAEHLQAAVSPLLWDLMVKLAAARSEIDSLNQLVQDLHAELTAAKDAMRVDKAIIEKLKRNDEDTVRVDE